MLQCSSSSGRPKAAPLCFVRAMVRLIDNKSKRRLSVTCHSSQISNEGQIEGESRPAFFDAPGSDGNLERPSLAEEDDVLPAACQARVEEIALEHCVVLDHERDDDDWIFGALCLMD